MEGKRLLKRIITVLLMSIGLFVLLAAIRAEALPIRPDVRKVLSEPQRSPAQFGPARAGWNGPEMASAQVVNTTYEQLDPAATARSVRQSLIAAALPDYRALGAIALVILLLRRMHKAHRRELSASSNAVSITIRTAPREARPSPGEDRAA